MNEFLIFFKCCLFSVTGFDCEDTAAKPDKAFLFEIFEEPSYQSISLSDYFTDQTSDCSTDRLPTNTDVIT